MKHQRWLILYDIREPTRLRRVEKVVSVYGERVQRSVFEAAVPESLIAIMEGKLKELIEKEDYVVVFPLCERDWQKAEKYGKRADSQFVTGQYEIL
jgi:CRISPR-associated protein Cas2